MADDVLCLKHNTLDRLKLIVMSVVGTQHKFLILGKSGIIYPMPILDSDGEYEADELYTINVKEL